MLEFVKMPFQWITNKDNPELRQLTWGREQDKAGNIAALMLYIVIHITATPSLIESNGIRGKGVLLNSPIETITGVLTTSSVKIL